METRELRYFVAVAEELHFGRAAQRLGIAQPPLSRAIGQLERRLGVTLFARTSRAVALTEAGSVLLREGRAALDAMIAAERRTQRAAVTAGPGLVLVTKAGSSPELLPRLLDAYAAEPGAVEVEVLLCGVGEQVRLLRDGRADVGLLHLPFDSTVGLDTEELSTEGQIAVLPPGHPFGGRDRVDVAELGPLPRWPTCDGTFPDGPGPEVWHSAQLLQLISLGRTCAILPESIRASLPRDLVTVPVPEAPRVTTVIAWPPHSRSRALAGLVRAAVSVKELEPDHTGQDEQQGQYA